METRTEYQKAICDTINDIDVKIEKAMQAIDTMRKILWDSKAAAAAIAELSLAVGKMIDDKEALLQHLKET